jgi:hypothetical protein
MQIDDKLSPLMVYKYEVSPEIHKLVRDVLTVIPDEWRHEFPSFSVYEASSPWYAHFKRHSFAEVGRLYSDPRLMELPREVALGLIAHEFAHLYLEHTSGGSVEGEYEADDLANRWGFQNEVKAMRQFLGFPKMRLL